MKQKNSIIFLHGKGKTSDDILFNSLKQIATSFDAEIIPITAQFKHRNGYRWHNVNKQPETAIEFIESINHITSEAKKILLSKNQTWNDLIWIGYSQGGDMAIRMALMHGAKRVIVFSADILSQFPLPANPSTNFQVDWVEAGIDNVLNQERKESYHKLQNMGIAVNYLISAKSKHFYIQETDKIIEKLDIKEYLKYIKGLSR